MEMLLMVLCMALFGVAVSAMAFGAATHNVDAPPRHVLADHRAAAPSQFFAEQATRVIARGAEHLPVGQQVPIELLLLQFEQHVRLEQAAAETFIHFPTPDSLRASMTSPLVQ